jgi:hypothetical protein
MPVPRIDRIARVMAAGTGRRQVLGGLLAAAVGAPVAAAQQATPTGSGREPGWLFVQAFDAATLAPDPATAGEYTLTLSGVDEAALAFSDHPDRLVMTIPTADYVTMVAGMADDPPNATLMAPLAAGERVAVVVELLSAEHDAAAGTVTYRVAVLAEEEGPVQVAATPLAAPTAEQVFGPGHLFIDPGGGGGSAGA